MDRIAKFEKVSKEQWSQIVPQAKGYDDIKLPKRATSGSAGYDFYSTMAFRLQPGETVKIATGIRCRMEDGWFLMMAPRSGLGFKYRLQLDNTIGIIDADYYYSDNEGHIFIKMTNCGDKVLTVEEGQAIAQGIFVPFGITEDDNVVTVRNGGFGSTDK